jgi:hypothetical protein
MFFVPQCQSGAERFSTQVNPKKFTGQRHSRPACGARIAF